MPITFIPTTQLCEKAAINILYLFVQNKKNLPLLIMIWPPWHQISEQTVSICNDGCRCVTLTFKIPFFLKYKAAWWSSVSPFRACQHSGTPRLRSRQSLHCCLFNTDTTAVSLCRVTIIHIAFGCVRVRNARRWIFACVCWCVSTYSLHAGVGFYEWILFVDTLECLCV